MPRIRANWTNHQMRVLIDGTGKHLDAEGKPHAPGVVHMVVDGHGLIVDLSKIAGTLVDPTILKVTWGLQRDGADQKFGGCIIRQDGSRQLFWDPELLKPYLDAWRLKRDELLGAPDA